MPSPHRRHPHDTRPRRRSCSGGGVAGGATRFVIHATDPVTLGVFRFGTGFPKAAVTITVNPVFASIVGALAIGEGIGLNLAAGLVAVAVGIWIATASTPVSAG
jgi:hypothetical protein